jgi:hypothetical protein
VSRDEKPDNVRIGFGGLSAKACTRIREILEDRVVARSKFLNGRGEGYGCSLQTFEATEVRYFCRGLRVPGREWKRFDSWSPQKASAEEACAQAVRKYASPDAEDQTGIALRRAEPAPSSRNRAESRSDRGRGSHLRPLCAALTVLDSVRAI